MPIQKSRIFATLGILVNGRLSSTRRIVKENDEIVLWDLFTSAEWESFAMCALRTSKHLAFFQKLNRPTFKLILRPQELQPETVIAAFNPYLVNDIYQSCQS